MGRRLLDHLVGPLALFVIFAGASPVIAADLSLIPWPANVVVGQGAFALTKRTVLVADSSFANEAALLLQQLRSESGLPLPLRTSAATAARDVIRLDKAPGGSAGAEAYVLEVTPKQVTLRASKPAGIFRGAQTLLQLLTRGSGGDVRTTWKVPCLRLEDAPRFPWRGLMLDCSRTFQSVDYLKHTLDRMALYKLNVLHLHLTDDQGWRLEITKYPELTAKGARFPARYNEPPSHEGFYTQEQMRGVVTYAARRHITIVPEIEMPGHSLAALSALPQLSCTGGPFGIFPFFKGPGITEEILCACKEETFIFLHDVLDEVMAIFPSEFVHIGGDEAPKTRWKACLLCQKRIQVEGLKNEAELQSWFNRRVEKMLAAKGRRLIGWDEILEGGLSPTAAVMSWRGTAGGVAAAKEGHDVVMSPTSHCYFDYDYGAISSARVFAFDPVAGLTAEAAARVLGLQANFWSHIDREPELVDAQLFPRLLALAERGWSPASDRDWPDYRSRAQPHLLRLRQLGIHYHPLDLGESVDK